MSEDKLNKNDYSPKLEITRRGFLSLIGLGFLGVIGSLVLQGFSAVRSIIPNVLYEPPKKFKVGPPSKFSEGATFLSERLFIINNNNEFHAISAICTHLGCTVNLAKYSPPKAYVSRRTGKTVDETFEFHCPCHGSKYRENGNVYAGPAPLPLPWYELSLAPDGQIVVNTDKIVDHNFRLKL